MEPLDLHLAQVAYKAYGQTTNFLNFQGNPMPTWEALPPKIQEAWIAASKAVRLEVEAGPP